MKMKNTDGLPTGAIYGFANALVKLIDSHKPTHIAVAWDTHAPTFRHEMDAEYKAHRPPQPEELREAIPYIKQMLGLFNIQSLERDGIEADDIVGSLAESARGLDVQVFMVTPDKDYMQLVHDNIFMMKPLNNGDGFEIIDRSAVEVFFGVPPEQVVDVLTIIGDSSDNIPGISGVGKKTAPELIKEYGNIENLIAAAPTITSKRVREGIVGNEDRIRLSRKLVVIKTDCESFTDWKTLKWDGPDRQALGVFFNRMQFRTLTKKFSGVEVPVSAPTDLAQADLFGESSPKTPPGSFTAFKKLDLHAVDYQCITSVDDLKKYLANNTVSNTLCIDTETTGVDPMTADMIGIALSFSPGSGVYIPLGKGNLNTNAVISVLNTLLNRGDLTVVAHHFKFDYMMLVRHGATFLAKIFDTMLAAYLIDPSQPLKMDALAMKYLDYEPIPIEALIGSGKKQKSMADIDLEQLTYYAVEDADITLQLYQSLSAQLKKDELEEVAYQIEFPLSEVLGDMELAGISLNTDMLASFSQTITADIMEIEQEIYRMAGTEFNINSPQQLGEILFKKLKLPSGKKTATGQFSTSEAVLSDLAVRYELPSKILEYRSLAKLRSTYIDALPPLIHAETRRIHTSFNQSVAATGRLSSSNPNLQNIPIRTQRGREIRKAFVSAHGYKLLSVDYSQIELRVIASMSGDTAMQEAFNSNEDIHSRTAREIFELDPLQDVDRDQRRKAKEVNFGIPYGVSAFGLAQRLGIGNNEAKDIIDAYFTRFPGVKVYIDQTKAFAHEHGYVKTLSGRRRYIPDINSGNFNVRSFAERTAINMPIQGTAADLIKIAMIRLARYFKEKQLKSRMLIQVHDELVFEVHESELEIVPDLVKSVMESAMSLSVPLKVEWGIADNWLDAH
jgi:DNA polymerase-1